jgi:BlaI family transcriptional regulator, penicillinase repressor
MKTLTRAEEQVMQVIWKIKEGFIRDVMEAMPAPKPHQNTAATILKILVEKEFVGIKVFGRQHQYYPLIGKDAYSKAFMKNLVKTYFGGSFSEAVSFMVKENTISLEDLEALLQQLKKGKK